MLVDPTSDDEDNQGHGQPEGLLDNFRITWQSELSQRNHESKDSSEVSSRDQSEQRKATIANQRRVSFADDVKPGHGQHSSSDRAPVEEPSASFPTIKEPILGHFHSGPTMATRDEEEAKHWFEEGVIHEQKGKLYDAVACYRKATQLVPDIEFKLYKRMANKIVSNPSTNDQSNADQNNGNNNGTEGFIELFTKLCINHENQFIVCEPDANNLSTDSVLKLVPCSSKNVPSSNPATSMSHISTLPFEVLLHTMKFVVSNDLDLHSLEKVSMVCRGFYLLSRDSEVWKLACINIWGQHVASDHSILSKYDESWRMMYIKKPRVNCNGIYISRATYIRQGELSFQDRLSSNYRPVHLVEYFRYFRFFPNGIALMLTSPDEPIACISRMKDPMRSYNYVSKTDIFEQYLKNDDDTNDCNRNQSSVIQGVYKLVEPNIVSILLKKVSFDIDTSIGRMYMKKSNRRQELVRTEQIFKIEMYVRSSKNKNNNQLTWKSYVAEYEKSTHGIRVVSHFDTITQPAKFPPFWYSKVKSYSNFSDGYYDRLNILE